MILEHQVLCTLRLVVELGRQLHVLNHSEPCCALELILIRHGVLHTHLPDLHKHILPQLVNLLNTLFLDALEQVLMSLLLGHDS